MVKGIRSTLTSYDGRIGRRIYWLQGVVPVCIIVAFFLVDFFILGVIIEDDDFVSLLWIPFGLFLTFVQWNVFGKRLHDLARSVAWVILMFIPFLNIIIAVPWILVLGILPGKPEANKYGSPPG